MRCPKCGYTSFDHNETCPKCNRNIAAVRDMLGLLPVAPVPVQFLASLLGEVSPDEGRQGQGEVSFQEQGASTLDDYMYEAPDDDEISTAGEVVLEEEEDEIAFSMDAYGAEAGGTETDESAPTETDGQDMGISLDAGDLEDDGQIDEDLETLALDMDEVADQAQAEPGGVELELESDETEDSSGALELELEPDDDDSSDSLELELEPDTDESLQMEDDEDTLPTLEFEGDSGRTLEFDEVDEEGGPYELKLDADADADPALEDTVPSMDYQPGGTLEVDDEDESGMTLELADDEDTDMSLELAGGDEPGMTLELADDEDTDMSLELAGGDEPGMTLELADDEDTDMSLELAGEDEPGMTLELADDEDTDMSLELAGEDEPGMTLELADDEDTDMSLELADEDEPGMTLELADDEDTDMSLELADEEDSGMSLELADEEDSGEALELADLSTSGPFEVEETLEFDDGGDAGPIGFSPAPEEKVKLELEEEDGGTLEFELEPDLLEPAAVQRPEAPADFDLDSEPLETLTLSGPYDEDDGAAAPELEGEQDTLDLRDLEPAVEPLSLEEPEGEELELEELESFGFDEDEVSSVSADEQQTMKTDFADSLDVENLLENDPELTLTAPEEEPGPFDLDEEDGLDTGDDLDLTELYLDADQALSGPGTQGIDPESTVVIDPPPQEHKPDTAEVDTLGLEENAGRPTDTEDFELDMADLELGLDDSELSEAADDLSGGDLDDEIDNLEMDLDDLSLDFEDKK